MKYEIIRYLKDSNYRFFINSCMFGMHKKMKDEKYLCRVYKGCFGKELDLANPQTYNEKMQWLKLFDRKDIYSQMVDKYEAKRIVANIIGEEHIIPTIGIWNNFDDIDFDSLPNQFVLKCTHDSGGLVICKNKANFDLKKAKRKINKSLKRNYYYLFREWPYKNVKPRIIAEEYMEDSKTGELRDYKFFTFNGKVKAMFVASDRQNPNEQTKFDFFDENYIHLDLRNGHPNAAIMPTKPGQFSLMKDFAEMLSKNTVHLRVDFYEINGKVYFGEMTFYHWSGFAPFDPQEWDYTFGEWLQLPTSNESK